MAQTALVSAVTLASAGLLGLVLAYWTWAWLAPRAEPGLEPAADPAGRIADAYALFGTVQRDGALAVATGIAIKLQGLMVAPKGKPGSEPSYAVVQLEGKRSLAVREGEDVAPGIRLAEIHPDHVVLERSGLREILAWPEKSKAPAAPALSINKFDLPSPANGASKKD